MAHVVCLCVCVCVGVCVCLCVCMCVSQASSQESQSASHTSSLHRVPVSIFRPCVSIPVSIPLSPSPSLSRLLHIERWGAGVETQKNVRGEIGGWGRVPFNEPYAPSLSTIYDGA